MKRILPVLIIALFSQWCHAQNFMSWKYNDRYFLIGSGAGWTGYFGELNHGKVFGSGLSNVNINIEARLYNHWSARIQAGYYEISGSDANASDSTFEQQRNLSFFSRNLDVSLSGIYHFFPYNRSFHKRRTYEPYALLGIGKTKYMPKTILDGTEYSLRDFATEGVNYKKWAWVIPVGLGVKARINDFIDVVLDITYHYTFTDYLDDVSSSYPESSSGLSRRLGDRRAEIGEINDEWFNSSQRGNSNKFNKDTYLTVDFKIQIYLPRGIFSKNGPKEKLLSKPSVF